MTSIRQHMVQSIALAVLGVTSVFCGLSYFVARSMLITDFESVAVEQLRAVANTVKVWTDGDIYVELNPSMMTGFAAEGDRAFAVRRVANGSLIAQSVSLDVTDSTLPRLRGVTAEAPAFDQGKAPNGTDAVVVAQVFSAQWGWDLTDTDIETAPGVRETQIELTLAMDRTPLDRRLRDLGLLTALIALASAIAAAGATFVAAGRALRPLNDLAHRTSGITEPTYDRPFQVNGPAELQPIAERLNDLLARLADAAIVERRFTTDAAHELRTPVAELRTLTDVALRYPTAAEQLENVIRSSNDISVRLTSLIDALLGIARRDVIAAELRLTPVDPTEQLRQSVAQFAPAADARDVTLALWAPDAHRIMSDATLMRSILDNLVGNAVAHAPIGATVDFSYVTVEEGFRLLVSNPAPELDASDLEHLFKPFWRKAGQQADPSHSGLGLALSKGFAEILGLTLHASLSPLGALEIVLEPQADSPDRQADAAILTSIGGP